MTKFEKVQKYYDGNLWSKEMVRNSVIKEWISAEEYTSIVGEEYNANE